MRDITITDTETGKVYHGVPDRAFVIVPDACHPSPQLATFLGAHTRFVRRDEDGAKTFYVVDE